MIYTITSWYYIFALYHRLKHWLKYCNQFSNIIMCAVSSVVNGIVDLAV